MAYESPSADALKTNKTSLKIKYICLFENVSMFLDFFLNKKNNLKNKTTKNKNKTCP